MERGLDRRDVIRLGGLAAAAGVLAPSGFLKASSRPSEPQGRTRSLRIAHLTDFHIQPEREAAEGVAACFAHVMAQSDKPSMIVTGGDLIMDGFASDEARTKVQWELFTKSIADHCPVPIRHALGNHDIWGWNKGKSNTSGNERNWGKTWAVETLGMPKRYHSFDEGAWHFIVLDSVQVDPSDPNGYIGRVDDEQWEWLEADLKANASKPTLVVSHVPILTATVMTGNADAKSNQRKIEGGLVHTDAGRLIDLFAKTRAADGRGAGGVRCCVSGHIHQVDRVDFRGVSYFCNGAVCGAWWKGPQGDCREGYALMDLNDDGSVERTYVPYGWKAG